LPAPAFAATSPPVMKGRSFRVLVFSVLALASGAARAQQDAENLEVRISIADQKLVVLRDGMWTQRFDVSTSKFGSGDSFGSYKTPLGRLRVCSKIGGGLPSGAVMNHRNATGEVLPVNARGRDPIVTRIIWLEGLESCNEHARSRGIYIHGTVEEGKIGKPVSYGCIRMRSRDVIDLFDELPVGALVSIQQEKLPRFKRWSAPPPPPMIAAKEPEKTKEPVAVAQRAPEKPAPKTEPAKIAAAKPDKPPVLVAQHKPAKVEIESRPSAATRLVMRASGTEDHGVRPADFSANAFKGSILFSDLPGQERRN